MEGSNRSLSRRDDRDAWPKIQSYNKSIVKIPYFNGHAPALAELESVAQVTPLDRFTNCFIAKVALSTFFSLDGLDKTDHPQQKTGNPY